MYGDRRALPNISSGLVSRVGRHKFSLAEFDGACLMYKLWLLMKATCLLMSVWCWNMHLDPSAPPEPPTGRAFNPLSRRDSTRWNLRNPAAQSVRQHPKNDGGETETPKKRRKKVANLWNINHTNWSQMANKCRTELRWRPTTSGRELWDPVVSPRRS